MGDRHAHAGGRARDECDGKGRLPRRARNPALAAVGAQGGAVSLQGRLDKLDGKLPPDPNAPPRILVVVDDAAGRWWEWDGETEIDPATVHPRTQVVIISERP